MSRKFFLLLIIIISLASVGLVFLQSKWIRIAVETKQDQFVQTVSLAMDRIVAEVEKQETVVQVIDEMKPFCTINTSGSARLQYQQKILNRTKSGIHTKRINQQVFTFSTLDKVKLPSIITHSFIDSSGRLNTREVLSAMGMEKMSNKLSNLSLGLDGKLINKKIFVESIVDKLIRVELPIRERITRDQLDSIIHTELERKGITARYEYKVTNATDSIIYRSKKYRNGFRGTIFKDLLFPNDFFARKYYLSLYFPNQNTYIIRSIGRLTILTLLLTLIIIATFLVTLYIIFKQKRISEIRNDFVSNMTHELKTPISTISLAAQMLNDGSIPNEKKNFDYLGGVIADESKRLGLQVEKVLQMAIFEKTKLKLKLKDVDLHAVIEKVSANFTLQLEAQQGKMLLDLKSENPVVRADEVHLTNVVNNLLDNALKYRNGVPEISIVTKDGSEGVVVSIKDNGIGITKEHMRKIFEQFYRVPSGNIHNVKGFGLGLSYVKKIVEAHGGRIWVDSSPGVGSEFSFCIPRTGPVD